MYEANIKWVADASEWGEDKKYVCPSCHGVVEYQTFERKSEHPVYDWNCGACFNSVDADSLHLMLEDMYPKIKILISI